jgi:hypothetical protein
LARSKATIVEVTMQFPRPPFRAPRPIRQKGPVFAVGHAAYVDCSGYGVTLTDDAGKTALASVSDGAEVEILGWRPRGADGTRYRVRAARSGLEGWLAATNLRGSPVAVPAAVPAPAAPPTPETQTRTRTAEPRAGGRRFGQRAC